MADTRTRPDITVRNTSDKTLYADATQGWFKCQEDGAESVRPKRAFWPLWTSGTNIR